MTCGLNRNFNAPLDLFCFCRLVTLAVQSWLLMFCIKKLLFNSNTHRKHFFFCCLSTKETDNSFKISIVVLISMWLDPSQVPLASPQTISAHGRARGTENPICSSCWFSYHCSFNNPKVKAWGGIRRWMRPTRDIWKEEVIL